jgi:hypothetical protein
MTRNSTPLYNNTTNLIFLNKDLLSQIRFTKNIMDQLSNLPNLSLAELRKILTDYDVKETSSSKESLMNQVSEVLLTNMMIQDMMEAETTQTETKQTDQRVKPPPVKDERTLLREQQDREYQASIAIDYQTDKNGDYLIEQPEQMDKDAVQYVGFEELSPRSLRAKRMEFYM